MIEPSRLPASIASSIRSIGGWLLLSALFFLTGCNPGGSSAAYVPYSVAPPASLGAKKTEDSPIEDSVSYWEGDSVTGPARIVIDVSDQRAYFYKGSQLVGVSKVSSGRDGFDTPQGDFKIIQKNKDHRSNLYGNYLWPNGEIAMKDIDVTKDKKPAGPGSRDLPCPTSCVLPTGWGCMEAISPDSRRPMVVSGCRPTWRPPSSAMSSPAPRSRCAHEPVVPCARGRSGS